MKMSRGFMIALFVVMMVALRWWRDQQQLEADLGGPRAMGDWMFWEIAFGVTVVVLLVAIVARMKPRG